MQYLQYLSFKQNTPENEQNLLSVNVSNIRTKENKPKQTTSRTPLDFAQVYL